MIKKVEFSIHVYMCLCDVLCVHVCLLLFRMDLKSEDVMLMLISAIIVR